jgi:hypothetical protein
MQHIHTLAPRGKPGGHPEPRKASRIFASADGRLRAVDGGRGGWRKPTALDMALSISPALQLGGYRMAD